MSLEAFLPGLSFPRKNGKFMSNKVKNTIIIVSALQYLVLSVHVYDLVALNNLCVDYLMLSFGAQERLLTICCLLLHVVLWILTTVHSTSSHFGAMDLSSLISEVNSASWTRLTHMLLG